MFQTPSFESFPQLETANLRLRRLQSSDADAVYRIFSDDEVTRYYDFDTFVSVSQAVDLIARQADRFELGEGIRWGITQKADNIVIGTCGYVYNTQNAQGGLGYDLGRSYWRRGIMSEALQLVVRFGFKTLRFNRIQALVIPGNVASANLLSKLGFREEGTLRDYAFVRGRYQDLRCFSILMRDYPE
jgi:ribosomal-protein-alanine N-acetyltransferase